MCIRDSSNWLNVNRQSKNRLFLCQRAKRETGIKRGPGILPVIKPVAFGPDKAIHFAESKLSQAPARVWNSLGIRLGGRINWIQVFTDRNSGNKLQVINCLLVEQSHLVVGRRINFHVSKRFGCRDPTTRRSENQFASEQKRLDFIG